MAITRGGTGSRRTVDPVTNITPLENKLENTTDTPSTTPTSTPSTTPTTTQTTTGTATPAAATTSTNTPTVQSQSTTNDTWAAYQSAIQKLQQTQQSAPTYDSLTKDAVTAAYDAIVNRDPFQYNLNEDQLYQQYRDQYLNNAQLSMRDTMGQAAALTGGYGSSYSQSVGQQAYDAQLQNLNDKVPELYSLAYGRWQDEGDALQNQYQMAKDAEQQEYDRYNDSYNKWYTEAQMAQNNADDAYNRWLADRNYETDRGDVEYERNKQERDDAYTKLVQLAPGGYTPSAEELAAAGLNESQWAALYAQLKPATGGRRKTWDQYYDSAYQSAIKLGIDPVAAADGAAILTAEQYGNQYVTYIDDYNVQHGGNPMNNGTGG